MKTSSATQKCSKAYQTAGRRFSRISKRCLRLVTHFHGHLRQPEEEGGSECGGTETRDCLRGRRLSIECHGCHYSQGERNLLAIFGHDGSRLKPRAEPAEWHQPARHIENGTNDQRHSRKGENMMMTHKTGT